MLQGTVPHCPADEPPRGIHNIEIVDLLEPFSGRPLREEDLLGEFAYLVFAPQEGAEARQMLGKLREVNQSGRYGRPSVVGGVCWWDNLTILLTMVQFSSRTSAIVPHLFAHRDTREVYLQQFKRVVAQILR